jgi:para-nitrobenzyl esterase
MEEIGVAMNPRIAALRAMPARALQDLAMDRMNQYFTPAGGGKRFFSPLGRAANPAGSDMPWWPVVDGYVLPAPAKQAFAEGCGSSVPLIIGWTSDEGSSFLGSPLSTPEDYEEFLANFAPEQDTLKTSYAAQAASGGDHRAGASIVGDGFFGYGVKQVAAAMSRRNPNVHVYYFSRTNANDRKANHGAPHSAFVLYGFGNLPNVAPWGATDQKIVKDAVQQWVAFAKTGDPNGPGLPEWPAYSPAKPMVLQIDDTSKAMPAPGLANDTTYTKVFTPFQHVKATGLGCNTAGK